MKEVYLLKDNLFKTMFKKIWCIFALALISLTIAQDISADLTNDPELLSIVINYFGCKTWEDGVCTECSDHYYFNNNGVCCEVKPQCRVFNREQGICEGCYQGYSIVDGQCVAIDLTNSDQVGCRRWEDGTCA